MARYWAVAGLELAECDYVPLDYAAYAQEVGRYIDETEQLARKMKVEVDLMPVRNAAKEWEKNGHAALEAARKAVDAGNSADAERLHRQLMQREFL